MQKTPQTHQALFEGIPFDDVMACIHCGLCLDACPTYGELGTEQDSPRGRLYLMRALWEGQLEPEPEVLAPLDRCLDCRACESVCPSKVAYGSLLEKTRAAVTQNGPSRRFRVRLLNKIFDIFFSGSKAPVLLSKAGRMGQQLGLQRLARLRFLKKLLPKRMFAALDLMPHFEGTSFKRKFQRYQAAPSPKTVALFTGCVMDVADHDIHHATVKLLEAAGYQVHMSQDQGCCGALHSHKGFQASAQRLAQQNLSAFHNKGFAAVLVNAAGCSAQLKNYETFPILSQSSPQKAGKPWSELIKDLLTLLSESSSFKREGFKQEPGVTVLYDAPCHQIHAQRSDAVQRNFLAGIPGVEFVVLKDADRCCGAGGIYNLLQPDLSQAVLDQKLNAIEMTMAAHPEASVLLTANPGCLYQLRSGIAARSLSLKVMHPAVFLAGRLAGN